MRFTKALVQKVVSRELGDEYTQYANFIYDSGKASDYLIANQLNGNRDCNVVRSRLYRLQEKGMVNYIKVKDKHKRYTLCFWYLNRNRILELSKKKQPELKTIIIPESSLEYYTCKKKCRTYRIEDAMELCYRCTECSSLLKPTK